MVNLVTFSLAAAAFLAAQNEAPRFLEFVQINGSRQQLESDYMAQNRLLPASFETSRGARLDRRRLRFFCVDACPRDLPRRRAAQDTIWWRDGRQTTGYVLIDQGDVEQNGRIAGGITQIDRVEFGTSRPPSALASNVEPTTVHLDPRDVGQRRWRREHRVFRQPWIGLGSDALTIPGHAPIPRGEIRFIQLFALGPRNDPPAAEDRVTWKDGSRTIGRVLVQNGLVEQPGRPPRHLRDVSYIELAPGS